ncbi:phage tail tape measure protein [Xenorhabdus innexi]|uniref:Phage tail tape measure protein n=1 Tax=Xenorhabdus innexi TaxID=290109 RepID=A0A1N6MRW7_9GAMM|nr:phage tail tape measure protein [Xenorhabdus innexi]PHM38592.1 phage tail tape measure protein [Xenorhabdus innexi]SIP71603.1 conserved membrane hypothetical protein [Xenorhabdus innexi]
MTDRNLNIRVSLNAANRLSGPLNAANRAAAGLSSQIRTTQNSVRNLQSQARTFERLTESVQKTTDAYEEAKQKVKALKNSLPPLAQQTDAQKRALETARAVRDNYGRTLDREKQRLRGVAAELYRHGISARNSSDVTGQVTRRTETYNRQLAEQQRRLTAVTQAQSRYAAAKDTRSKLATSGATAMATGIGSLYGMSRVMAPGLDFDEGMSTVQALTRLSKDDPRLNMLREQARQLGATTAYTATDAAAGQKFLAMAGFTPESVKAALPGVLNMGLAGEVELGEAADIGSNVLTQFSLNADQMDRVSDVLTATFTRSNTDLRQLGETMTYAGPIAAEVGVSLESMAAMAGLMADQGIRGSMAGTSLRAGLSRMVAPTGGAADAMAALGVKVKKSNGELRDADDILKEMAVSLRKYDQASQIRMKKDIFGEEAMVGMGAVLNGTLNGKYDEKKTANVNAKGESAKNARVKINNLKGDIKQLKSAWEDLGIQVEESVDSPLRSVTQRLTGLLGKIGAWMKAHPQLTSALAKGAIAIGVTVTALGALALAAAAVIVPFAALRLSLFMLTRGGGLTALFPALGKITTGLRAAGGGFGALRLAGQAAMSVIGGGLSLLLSPLGLLIAAIVVAAVLIWKYWEPIKAWFAGFFSGLMEAIAPVRDTLAEAFAPFAPIFDAIGNAIKKVWEWFKSLFEPVNTSAESLKAATEAGQTFGRLVGKAIAGVVTVIAAVAKGVGWLLEKLGMIPDATQAAAEAANVMGPVNLPDVQKSVKWVWDDKTQKMVQQEWLPTPPDNAITQVGEKADEKKPAATPPVTDIPTLPSFGSQVYDPDKKKPKSKTEAGSVVAAGQAATPADPNRLGEIVFKNRPPVLPIEGNYQEPRLQQPSLLTRLTEKLQPLQPALSGVPVPITPTRNSNTHPTQPDRYSFNLHFHGVDMQNTRSIADLVKAEIEKLMQKQGVRRRSRLYDED